MTVHILSVLVTSCVNVLHYQNFIIVSRFYIEEAVCDHIGEYTYPMDVVLRTGAVGCSGLKSSNYYASDLCCDDEGQPTECFDDNGDVIG